MKLSVFANYNPEQNTHGNGRIDWVDFLALLTGTYTAVGGSEALTIGSASFDDPLVTATLGDRSSPENTDAPAAYLNYLFFDKDRMLTDQVGFEQVSSTASGTNWEELTLEMVAAQKGFLLVYLSNETHAASLVNMDDLTIYHGKTNVVAADDYYPFALTFNSFTRSYSEPQNYKFNGIERQPELGWDLAEFRSYDPATARWHQIDPKANEFTSPYAGFGNNPIFYTDHRGDTVDISNLSATQQETYNYTIGFLRKSELFAEYYTQLQESETTYTIKAGKGEKGKPQESGQYFNPNTNEVGLGESMGAYVVAQELFHAFQSDGEFYKDNKPKPLSTIETEGDVATIYVMGESGGLTPMYGNWSQDILYDSFDGTPSLEKIQSQGYQQMFQKAVDDRIEYYKGSGLNAPTYTAPNTGVKPKALENLIKRVTGN